MQSKCKACVRQVLDWCIIVFARSNDNRGESIHIFDKVSNLTDHVHDSQNIVARGQVVKNSERNEFKH